MRLSSDSNLAVFQEVTSQIQAVSGCYWVIPDDPDLPLNWVLPPVVRLPGVTSATGQEEIIGMKLA
jgi:hypothetical protein